MIESKGAPLRRRKGEGTRDRMHKPECPPPGADGERPEHRCTGLYRARLTVTQSNGVRKRVAVYGTTQRELDLKVRKLVAVEQREGIAPSTMTVEAWLAAYYAENVEDWKLSTQNTYRSVIERWLIPNLGRYRLDRLTPQHVVGFYDAMSRQGMAPSTIRQCHAVLARSLRIAMRRGFVTRNVASADHVEPPRGKGERRACLNIEESLTVLNATGHDARWSVAFWTGLRQGEALALRWSDVHLDGTGVHPYPHLSVSRGVTKIPGGPHVFHSPKSAAGVRVVPLVPPVREALAKRRAAVLDTSASAEELIFPAPLGGVLDANTDRRRWAKALKLAGVPEVTLHSARNTCAGLLENAGLAPRVVALILGHAKVDMTFHYQHGNSAALGMAVQQLDTYLKSLPGVPA